MADDVFRAPLADRVAGDYETIAASQTAQALGAAGAVVKGILVKLGL